MNSLNTDNKVKAVNRLLDSITDVVTTIDADTKVLCQDKAYFISRSLRDFCVEAVRKYIAGQKEHGGSLEDRNCLLEARKETIDLFWYLTTEKERREK